MEKSSAFNVPLIFASKQDRHKGEETKATHSPKGFVIFLFSSFFCLFVFYLAQGSSHLPGQYIIRWLLLSGVLHPQVCVSIWRPLFRQRNTRQSILFTRYWRVCTSHWRADGGDFEKIKGTNDVVLVLCLSPLPISREAVVLQHAELLAVISGRWSSRLAQGLMQTSHWCITYRPSLLQRQVSSMNVE